TVKLISANHNNAPISGADITLCRVADYLAGKYLLMPEYASLGMDLNNLNTAQKQAAAAGKLALFIEENQLPGIEHATDSAGKVEFADLSEGLYLLRVTGTSGTGITMAASPFLVSIPIWNPDGAGWLYNVIAEPKSNTYTDGGGTSYPPPDIEIIPPPDVEIIPPIKGKPIALPRGKLPQTGQNLISIGILLTAGILLIVLGSCRLSQGRKESED
ncbi:MAG: hypothetical protein RR396_05070, partial [Clostridiales bacterium]